MATTFPVPKTALSEEACLAETMRLRHGGTTIVCPACGQRAAFAPQPKRRACACQACGHDVFPCLGTPFEKLQTPLTQWFIAAQRLRQGGRGFNAAALVRETGTSPKAAARMLQVLRDLSEQPDKAGVAAGWLDAMAAAAGGEAGPPRGRTAIPVPQSDGEPKRPASEGPGGILREHRLGIAAAAVAVCAALAGLFITLDRWSGSDLAGGEDEAPVLTAAPPTPSLKLASVDEDLAAAKAAVAYVAERPPTVALPAPTAPPVVLPAPAAPTAAPVPTASGDPNEVLTFGPMRIRRHLVETIVKAGRVVGADPTLLMAVADKESSFKTEVKAQTSSATGLFQFIERTWLGVVQEFGARHGLANEARLIQRTDRGPTVADPAERLRILELRREPYLSALLAAEMLKKDTLRIERRIGRNLTGGEIYLVHFLGPDGAETFIGKMEEASESSAADLLPRPAQANKSIFYGQEGGKTRARSVAEVHKNFEAMITTRLDRYRAVRMMAGVPVR